MEGARSIEHLLGLNLTARYMYERHFTTLILQNFQNVTENGPCNFQPQQWLYLGMNAPCGHGKILDLSEKQTTHLIAKTLSNSFIESKQQLALLCTSNGPEPPKSFRTLYLYQTLDFHLRSPEVN